MKTILAYSLALALLVLPVGAIYGATVSIGTVKPSGAFDVSIPAISKLSKSGSTFFSFEPTKISTSSIAYWKVRVYCEDKVNVSIGTSMANGCGKAQNYTNAPANKFSVTLNNPSNKLVGFSFALKAYDKNGKWIHTEERAYRWK